MPDNDSLLFILGAGKTATSSLCGVLNSHPDVLSMYEVYLNKSIVSRYGAKLLKAYPELLPCFIQPYGADALENYRRAQATLRAMGYGKSYFGDKWVGIDSGYAETFKDVRVVFSVRPLPEWIAKDSVRGWFPVEIDVVPFAVQYAKHFIESFLIPRIYHVHMEEFLQNNAAVVAGIWNFLGIAPPPNADRWWETVGHYPPEDPKTALNWWRGHASSAVAPRENDTRVALRRNAFWDELLPIFEKYYSAANSRRFESVEIEADLHALQALVSRHRQPFASCFETAHSESHNPRFKDKRRDRRTAIGRMMAAIGLK